MRFNYNSCLFIILVFLAPLTILFDFGLGLVFLSLFLLFGLKLSLNYWSESAQKKSSLVLESISISHYVEKVRWSLDHLGVEYREQRDIGILGFLLMGRTVPILSVPQKRVRIGNSSLILRYLWGTAENEERANFLKANKEAMALEKEIDRFGEDIRRWAYFHVLQDPNLGLQVWGFHDSKVPSWQRKILKAIYPLLRFILFRLLNVNQVKMEKSLKRSQEMFDKIDGVLADGRKYLLGGDEMSFIDITWASLAAIAVLPEEYGAGKIEKVRLRHEQLQADAQEIINDFRKRPAGKFVLNLYKNQR